MAVAKIIISAKMNCDLEEFLKLKSHHEKKPAKSSDSSLGTLNGESLRNL